MPSFIIKRLLAAIPLLFVTSIFTFVLVINAGDPLEDLRLRPGISPEVIRAEEARLGLDKPARERYVTWITNFVQGDMGQDVRSRDVWPQLWRAMQVTLRLVVFAAVVAVVLGVSVGVISAVRQYSAFDYSMTGLAFLFFAMPVFWFAYLLKEFGAIRLNDWLENPGVSSFALLVLTIAVGLAAWGWARHRRWRAGRQALTAVVGGIVTLLLLGWFDRVVADSEWSRVIPTVGASSPRPPEEFWPRMQDYFWHLLLPSITLIAISFAGYSRYERASMLDNLGSDHVRTARAKGLSERRVVFRHAFRNSLIPLTTVVALDFGVLISGAIITERVFAWKGMGSFFIDGLQTADPNKVLAFVMVTAISVVVFNTIADILYALLDPRIRVG